MRSCRRMLSQLMGICVGVYVGLLLNSHLHLESLSFPIEQLQAPLLNCKEKGDNGVPAKQESKQATAPHKTVESTSAHPICQRLQPIPSTLAYWTQHISQIHAATQLSPYDTRFYFHDFTAQLLQLISPRLPQSVLSVPQDWSVVQSILDKAHARYEYLQDATTTKPFQPPVKIVILGGSVLVGRNCRKLMKQLGVQGMLLPNRACTWAYRLQIFLDQLFIKGLFDVTKISMGGTNTAVGAEIFEFDLLPPEARSPDIVLNAYSTNDMHILTIMEAETGNQTLRDRVFEITQEFVRTVLRKSNTCPTTHAPLLLHLDDYLGNEQREIWATTELSQGVQVLSNYYGFATMSYANVVRQWVYGDTKETWFSPDGWYNKGNKMEREIHPGMGMHIAATWVVAYNLLNLVTTYCSMEPWLQSTSPQDMMDYSKSFMSETLPLRGQFDKVPGKPKVPPQSLPPLLTPELSLETISSVWRASDERERANGESTDCSNGESQRCIFSWVSGMSQQHNNRTWIEEYFGANEVVNNGWKLVDDGGKLGYSPSGAGDEVILDFSLSQVVRAVTLFTLKSYGEKWEHSKLRVSVEVRSDANEWTELASHELVGFHNKETSEMYTKTITLPNEVKQGSSLRVRYQLASGKTFKIMGLAVCS